MAEYVPTEDAGAAVNIEVNQAVSWDDRKTILDAYYDAGGKVPDGVSLADMYPALIAVASWGARRVAEVLVPERADAYAGGWNRGHEAALGHEMPRRGA